MKIFSNLSTLLTLIREKVNYKTLLKIVLLLAIALVVFVVGIRIAVRNDIPSTLELSKVKNPLASSLHADDGELIGEYFIENRTYLESDDLNSFYRNALLATEDIRFNEHSGIDYRGLLRVLFKTLLLQKQSSGGGSTITQQLAKNLFPRKPYSTLSMVKNKMREMVIAKRIEKLYSKEEILLLYSNTVSFGEKAFGLGTASKRFFNKESKDLLLEEAAVLVGLLKATSYYSPRNNPKNAVKRRNVVLQQMVKYGFISKQTKNQLSKLPLKLNYKPSVNKQEFAPYFKAFVEKEFNKWSASRSKPDGSKYDLLRDGLKVYTTLNLDYQIAAEEFMASHMNKLQGVFLESWKTGRIFGKTSKIIDDKITKHPDFIKQINNGKTTKEALASFTVRQKRKIWGWKGYKEKNITKIDSIKHNLKLLHTGILAVQPNTGAIKVWVGGVNFNNFQYDNVLGKRQVGSTFKPIVYLAGLESGITPCDTYDNELKTYTEYQDWTPRNANNKYGGKLTIKNALKGSVNTVSAQVLFKTGIPKVIETSRKLGISSRLDEVPSIVLGTSDISLFEMIQAYSVFANNGVKKDLVAISRIEDAQGNVIFNSTTKQANQVVQQDAVKQLNGMLQLVTKEGTGRSLYANYDIDIPVMGKTGTTQNQSDGWFIGFNKDLVVGAWVGASDRRIHFRNLGTGAGGRTALPLVASLFEYVNTKQDTTAVFPKYELAECFEELDIKPFEINIFTKRGRRPEIRQRRYQKRQQDRYYKKRRRAVRLEKARKKWKKRFNSIFKRRN